MGRYKTRSQKVQDSLGARYAKTRGAIIEIRILVGLGEKSGLDEIVRAVKELVGARGVDNVRKEITRLEDALKRRGGRGYVLDERIKGLREQLEKED